MLQGTWLETLSDSWLCSLAKSTGQSFSDFKLYAAVNSGDCREKSSPPFEVRFGTVKGKLMLFGIISQVRSTNFRDKLQLVNSVKRLVFDLRSTGSISSDSFQINFSPKPLKINHEIFTIDADTSFKED